MTTGMGTTSPMGVRIWEKPQNGWVRVNVDAAVFKSTDCIGLRSVVQGSQGQFIMARNTRKACVIPRREGEALGLKEALSWLKNKSFKICVFETDSRVLARACQGVNGRSYFDMIVSDCI